jgi:hypothetical protein
MKKPIYTDKEALMRSITISEENIKRFEEAILKERETIFEFKMYIKEINEWNKLNNKQ